MLFNELRGQKLEKQNPWVQAKRVTVHFNLPQPGFEERIFHSSVFSAEGRLISALAVPHRGLLTRRAVQIKLDHIATDPEKCNFI